MLGFGLVCNVDVVKHGIHCLNSWYGHIELGRQFDWGSQESLDFHRASGLEVLVHGARCIGRSHLLDRLLSGVARELAALGRSQVQELIDDARYQLAHADFLKELGWVRGVENHACGMKSDRSVHGLATRSREVRGI